MSAIPEALAERALQWVFGDDEVDPGLIVSDGRAVPELRAWLVGLEHHISDLKRTLGVSVSESLALARLHALIVEVERAAPRSFPAQLQADVAAPVVSIGAYRKRTRRNVAIIGAAVLAIAAALFLLVGPGATNPKVHDVDATIAEALTRDIAPDSGFGFGGAAEPTARDRGFLIGAVIDLSKPRASGQPSGAAEVALAQTLASRALQGLDAPDDKEARRQRALGGCAAVFGADP